MAFTPSKSHLSLIIFFTFTILAHSKLNLDPSDHDAILVIQKELGLSTCQSHSLENPCDSAGIFCEPRVVNKSSYVLKITRLGFESQQLKGYLSPAIGKLSELKELSLPNNQLVHQIPPEIAGCQKLEILNLRNNRFSSNVPMELSSLIRLRILDLSSNKLSGNLSFLKYFPSLEKLSLADNMFSGKVPSSLKWFRNLRFVNVSGNTLLEGPAPEIEKLAKRNIIPKRYILAENSTGTNQPSAVAPSTSKNPNPTRTNQTSSVAPSARNGTNSTNAPAPSPQPPQKHKNNKKKLTGYIVGFVGGVVGGSLSGFIFSVLFKLIANFIKGEGKDTSLAIFSPMIKKAEDLAFLKNDDGLASLEIIGRGGCGEVYKAELSNGKMIAIKKVIQPPRDAQELADEDSKLLTKKMRQIKSEIQTVGQIRHRNLLPLLAHMPRHDCHYLVYEYMKNGSLQDVLVQVTEGKRELDWLSRHRIALGIAAGLEYLHMNHTPRIIHRDLKPANVLLDDDMEARISDFGLAKAMPEMHTHVTTSNVAGTVGYIAPEYHQMLKFTDKCDIYGFGVLLGVLVMGKLPSNDFFQHTNEMSLVKWMRNIMTSEDPKIAIDPTLLGNGYEEQMLLVLKIACFCTLDNPKERPNSKDVRLMLTQINH